MERSRWLCLQHRLLQAEKGLLLDTSSKGRRPKVGGAFCGPKNQRIDTGCVITSNVFVGGHFLDLGLLWKVKNVGAAARARFGTTRGAEIGPALQREHDSERAEARK